MKLFFRISACLIAGSLLLCMLTAIQINPDMLSENSVVMDSETLDSDQQKLYEELFDPNSMVEIDIDISKQQIADMQRDYEYYSKKKRSQDRHVPHRGQRDLYRKREEVCRGGRRRPHKGGKIPL
jgi:hypothetical protein